MLPIKKYPFEVPKNKIVRVIIDTDAACEADDQFAIVHALLSPKLDVRGITAEHFHAFFGEVNTMEKSYSEILKVLDILKLNGKYPVYRGVADGLRDEITPAGSDAAHFIIEEARRENETQPLFVVCQGALTNVADALLVDPDIAQKLTVIWIGGGKYPEGGSEFNCMGDPNAVNVVMDSKVALWQVPDNVYSMMTVGFSELYHYVYPCGEIGKYLVENLFRFSVQACTNEIMNEATSYPVGESWRLGDSPILGLLLSENADYIEMPAPRVEKNGEYRLRPSNCRKIRVYQSIDSHFIFNDMYSKLAYNYANL
ncbi:MAG TPA: nucleoside hydrolase [Clostridiales bacterium]|nr:nucleoside hydrolase [Clostridiales bacterium]